MAGYDFTVQPAQIESPLTSYSKLARLRLEQQASQENQIKLSEAKRQEASIANQRAAATSAYQPQSYTPQAQSLDVGGANLGYQPATVQGPNAFNRGSYLDALQKTDPMAAMQADQAFQAQDIEHQKQMAALSEAMGKASGEQLKNLGTALDLQGRYIGAVDQAPPELKPQIYAQARASAVQAGIPGADQLPPQYDPATFDSLKTKFMDVKQAADLANARINQQITMRGQDMTAQTAKAGQAVTVRGQNMVDARAKDANASAGSQVMQVPQPDGTVKLQRFNVGDALPAGAKTTAAAQKDEEAATVDEKKKADLVTNARENLAALRDIITRRPELFGPYAGRLTSLRAAAGTSDKDISKLAGIKDRFGMVNQGLHSMRSASHVAEAGDAVLNKMRNSPEATLSAINEAENSLDTFQLPVSQQRGNLTGNAAPSGATHAVIVGGKIIGYTADGKTMVPTK